MAKYEFSVRYAGDAIVDGRIPIKDLAPSLLSLSEALQEYQTIAYPYQEPVSLDIKATDEGSFIVDLLLVNGKDLLSQAIDVFTGKESDAIQSLIAIVTGFSGAVAFIKKLAKAAPTAKEKVGDGEIKITFDDKTSLTMPKESYEASKNIEFRKRTKEFVKPLNKSGINTIEVIRETEKTLTITKDDKDSFEVPELIETELEPTESIMYLQIINISFADEKWKLTDGGKSFYARIEDKEFVANVKNNKTQFGANDTLKVQLRTKQKITDSGLKPEYAVVKVLQHIKGAQQIEFDFGDSDE